MFGNVDEIQKMSKETIEASVKNLSSVSKAVQTIATELTDYSKKSFEQNADVMSKLLAAKTLDGFVQIQMDYFKSFYEGSVAEATKIGQLYANLAQESAKPFEAAMNNGKKAA